VTEVGTVMTSWRHVICFCCRLTQVYLDLRAVVLTQVCCFMQKTRLRNDLYCVEWDVKP